MFRNCRKPGGSHTSFWSGPKGGRRLSFPPAPVKVTCARTPRTSSNRAAVCACLHAQGYSCVGVVAWGALLDFFGWLNRNSGPRQTRAANPSALARKWRLRAPSTRRVASCWRCS